MFVEVESELMVSLDLLTSAFPWREYYNEWKGSFSITKVKFCFYSSGDQQWVDEQNNLVDDREMHIMTMLPNANSSSTTEMYPVVIGGMYVLICDWNISWVSFMYPIFFFHSSYVAEIFNHDGMGQWKPYFQMDTRLWSIDCFTKNPADNMLYAIYREEVLKIDPFTGQITVIKDNIPAEIALPGRCVVVKNKDGNDGIMTRYGIFYNLVTNDWESLQAPPIHPWDERAPNSMYVLNGMATVFGSSECDESGTCKKNRIVQYDPQMDEWNTIGVMKVPRSYHTVVSVPAAFCDQYVDSSQTTTAAPSETTTTAESGSQNVVFSFVSLIVTFFVSKLV